MNLFGVWEDL